MYSNFSFLWRSACCYLTCGIALAYPSLPGSGVEGLIGFEHESGEGLFEVYNRGKLLNRNRPPDLEPAPSHLLVEAHGTDVGGYHSYQGVPIHTLMPFPDGRKRQKVGSGAYDGTMPPGVQDGVQVCMGNVGVYPEGFPWETRKNPNHGRLVFEKEDTNVPLLNPIVEGASSPEAYWLSRVNVELSGTDPKVRIRTDQLAFNTFSDLGVVVAAGDQRKEKHHAKTQHVPQSPDPSTGESYFPQESSQDVTFTEIAHEAHPKDVDRSPKAKKQVEGRVNLPQMVSESEEKVDEYLSKIHLPRRRIAMSDQFLKGFTEQFRRKLGEVFKLNSKGNSINAGLKGGSTLRISQNKTIELYLIRVFNNHQARTTPQDAHVLQGKEMIFCMLVRLIEWLLLINKVVLTNIIGKDMSYSDEYTYHKRLVDWLFHQAFNPGGSILPVLGATKTIQGKDFGPVQIILSIYLSESLKSNKAFGTSNDIIRFYYENIHIIDLKGIRNLDENKILEKSLKRLIYQAIVSGLVIDNPILRIGSASSQFGNLKIPPLNHFPKSMRPQDNRIRYKVKLNKQEEDIINHLDKFLTGCYLNHNAQNLEAEEIPVSLRKLVYNAEQDLSEGEALITMSKKSAFGQPGLLPQMNRLIVYLKACHIGLEEMFRKNQRYKEVLNNHKLFYEWFHDLLFKKEENMLPIFGNFVVKDRNYFKNPPRSSDYSEMKILLINYFGGLLQNEEIIRLALSLIGYFNWFKDQDSPVSSLSSQDENHYWNTVIGILDGKFKNNDCHSLKSFFQETNI
ncbi:hypothetical protein MJO28_002575 [Puccinia striiformis f. sp. tritici]|uniref:Uncharacterized protein n=1 Tax=Puccinia striiformis f. sp. tritici TaxID=168172 RepID=A0ACC0EQU4_9BASI|nr:hypothetical protein MJO28_002575 [Puccinia striiformis f. sp. tritici]